MKKKHIDMRPAPTGVYRAPAKTGRSRYFRLTVKDDKKCAGGPSERN